MLLGLISDTHDRVPAMEALTRTFSEAGVRMILHAGDHCSPFSMLPLIESNIPVVGVFGRNDGDHEGLRAQAATGIGTELYESPHSFEVSGKRILLVHEIGDVADNSVSSHAVVVHGHTHLQEMKSRGGALIVNPGEACGWLHGSPCAALLDLNGMRVEFLKLPSGDWTR